MPANYVLLGKVNLAASAASVTLNNIPQSGYTDLKIVMSARSTQASYRTDIGWYFNSSSADSTYSFKKVVAYEGGAVSSGFVSTTYVNTSALVSGDNATSNTFGSLELYVPNYLSSNNKSYSYEWTAEINSGASYILGFNAGLWANTSAINSITFVTASGSFIANSTFYLYGLAAVGTTPVIAPFATGGDIVTNDGTYWYHAFLSSGTFTANKNLTASCLVVAGGGAGGSGYGGGGGGAGGLQVVSNSTFTATNYPVVIGAGGPGKTNGAGAVGNGSASSLNSISSTGGGGGGNNPSAGIVGGNGGSGGGGPSFGPNGGTGITGQGYAGGNGKTTSTYEAGGGGGSASAGVNGGSGGTGGSATTLSSWATPTNTGVSGAYAGGGGGGSYYSGGTGSGGGGGATNGSNPGPTTNATANTGSGSGGAGEQTSGSSSSGNGGSGIVIIRYPMV